MDYSVVTTLSGSLFVNLILFKSLSPQAWSSLHLVRGQVAAAGQTVWMHNPGQAASAGQDRSLRAQKSCDFCWRTRQIPMLQLGFNTCSVRGYFKHLGLSTSGICPKKMMSINFWGIHLWVFRQSHLNLS